jgi:N-acetylglucosamine repressor
MAKAKRKTPIGGVQTLTGNAAVLKQINTVRLLNHLRVNGPSSRAQLARATGLDAKTITNLSNRLLKDELVQCGETVTSGRGRPAERLGINPDAALAVGVDIGASQITIVLSDLAGNIRGRFKEEFRAPKGKAALIRRASTAVHTRIDALAPALKCAVRGVGVAVPGMLDRAKGVVVHSVNIPGFQDVPIVDMLHSEFGLPVELEESSRAMAVAEIWFATREERRNFACVDLGYGIGMAMVSDGMLYRGANELAGEIGHTVVVSDGKECQCGRVGCLETVASGRAIGEMASRLPLKTLGIKAAGAQAVCQAADAGNPEAIKVLRKAGEYIGVAVANMINLFDPGRVILNGGLVNAGELLIDPLRIAVREHTISPLDTTCPVEVSPLGEYAGAMGAAMLPLRAFFEFDNIRL